MCAVFHKKHNSGVSVGFVIQENAVVFSGNLLLFFCIKSSKGFWLELHMSYSGVELSIYILIYGLGGLCSFQINVFV